MNKHALAIAGDNFDALKAWLNGNANLAACPASNNCFGALAELVFALRVRGELVGHDAGHDVISGGQTYEIRTRSNGSRPKYHRTIADHFVDVKIRWSGSWLTATEVWLRPGSEIANDGIEPR